MKCLFGPKHGYHLPVDKDEPYVVVTCMAEEEVPIDWRKWRSDAISPVATVHQFIYRRMKIHWRRDKDHPDRELKTEVLVPREWDDDRVMETIFYSYLT